MNEKFISTALKLSIVAISGACATNIIINGKRKNKNKKEASNNGEAVEAEVVDVVEDAAAEPTQEKATKKKAPKTITLDVDENGNVINPIKFKMENMNIPIQ